VLVGSFAVAACSVLEPDPLPPEGQLVIGITTDAWLPRGAGDAYEPVPRSALFERLRIELFAPGEQEPCRDCLRDFGIDHGTVTGGRASVGFVPRPNVTGYRARVRLYHSGASESSAEPRVESTIETVVALPPVAEDGIVEVHVALMTDDLSRPRGTLAAPVAAEAGPPPKGLAGTWHQEVLRDCAAPARAGEACVPGGAFWMGDPAFAVPYERLVALSPFYIDAHEVTTGEVRASGLATLDPVALTADPYLYSSDPAKTIHYCTYTQFPGTQEDLPVNCISRALARKLCAKRGAELASEAQFEFVAGARRDATFPWGEAEPTCADAVYARDYDTKARAELKRCAPLGVGAARPGSGRLDRVRMPDGNEIVDLAGNLSEWILDEYQAIDEPCFAANPRLDPVCREVSPKNPTRVAVRGEPWTDLGGAELRAAIKQSVDAKAVQDPRIGFRCARPGL
jgi:formylglycine-generating enzyme required for sulfatase activity